jgi:AraC-like DNA-binding protein
MPKISRRDHLRKQKYWLIISLLIFNLLILVIDLALIGGYVTGEKALLAKTLISMAFVYIVLSSIFRVFNESFNIKPLSLNEKDRKLAGQIQKMIDEEKPFLNLGFNRVVMADSLAVTEQHLSRVINITYKKSFTDLMNSYRLDDARKFLEETDLPITQISFDVGFSSITSFNRVFKESSGMSPSDYRSSIRKKS